MQKANPSVGYVGYAYHWSPCEGEEPFRLYCQKMSQGKPQVTLKKFWRNFDLRFEANLKENRNKTLVLTWRYQSWTAKNKKLAFFTKLSPPHFKLFPFQTLCRQTDSNDWISWLTTCTHILVFEVYLRIRELEEENTQKKRVFLKEEKKDVGRNRGNLPSLLFSHWKLKVHLDDFYGMPDYFVSCFL